MSFEDSQQTERVTHATLVFEREVPATVKKVFAAFANAKIRSEWGVPSDTATIIYDQEDFREGGEDRFRCGSKSNPNIHVTTHYLEIIPDRRIVSSGTVSMGGKHLCASLMALELAQSGSRTKLRSTSQVASFIGQDMIKGTDAGNNGSLDNLVNYFSREQA
jgi:uncharacterized protein YndB with AHSA1/START domain